MSLKDQVTIETVLFELEAAKTAVESVVGEKLDDSIPKNVIADLFVEKVQDAFYQRFRDWHPRKLLIALEVYEQLEKKKEHSDTEKTLGTTSSKKTKKPTKEQIQ